MPTVLSRNGSKPQSSRSFPIAIAPLLLLIAAAPAALAQPAQPADTSAALALTYPVDHFVLKYSRDIPGLPPLDFLSRTTVRLTLTGDAYAAYQPGDRPIYLTLANKSRITEHWWRAAAIASVSRALVSEFNSMGIGGVRVRIDPRQFAAEGQDVRPGDDHSLILIIDPLPISKIETFAAGERINPDQRQDNPAHQRLVEQSPVQPEATATDESTELLRTDLLNEYLKWLNRFPGRRVDAAVTAGDQPDTLALRFLVQETKPWLAYFQASNTGTKQTDEWRERFGFVDYQLTGNDDILSIDYATAGFDASHAVVASYDAPFINFPRFRWKVQGVYSRFVASDVGAPGAQFRGDSHSVSGELSWNFFQQGDLFLDTYASVTHQRVAVTNELLAPGSQNGEDGFFRPAIGLRSQYVDRTSSFFGSVGLEWNAGEIAGTDAVSASRLGRSAVDADWTLFNWDLRYNFYLEPLLWPDEWNDLSTWQSSTLAHEIALALHGQQVFGDDRVIPQLQQTAGGLYSVRGYRESAAVGDNAVILSAEYRFHLPQIFQPESEPHTLFGQPFRWAPQTPQGRADWDLVLKAFIDYAHTSNNNAQLGESDEDLLGAGLGVDVLFKRNVNLRFDWGTALLDAADTTAGSRRFHISVTLLY